MATLEIFNISILFLFSLFLPHRAATPCNGSTCSIDGPVARFPFQIRNNQVSSNCGYPGFDLSCNNQSQTIITFPSSGDFIVQSISYLAQILYINGTDNCMPKRFLHRDLSFEDTPFSIYLGFEGTKNYTFFNCSSDQEIYWPSNIISCISTEYYKVLALPTNWSQPRLKLANCTVISTTLVPSSFEWQEINQGFMLTWDVPDCGYCEERDQACGLTKGKSSTIQCLHTDKVSSVLSKEAKFGIMMGVGIPGLLFFVWLVLHFCNRTVQGQNPQPITELSTLTSQQPSTVVTGLYASTIESYPKTQLGESWELPKPNDNSCPICLSEYKSKETLRTIPECNHYFHANCVDEWLRMKATCPLCRNPQEK
ncbi:hypothetical protein PRUPE_5G119700 [Prunus persica]|uniref:RING-type E3 ubiquitin transferase n=1 Tax=Prunus persica TaxID=3760 RepID=M5W9R7_PRUPE|nr:RING-H2 finger protein ATL22 [Prunus persica]ONI07425.1 hypothetical protein PRUPE_5G119700 [Prunus persica]